MFSAPGYIDATKSKTKSRSGSKSAKVGNTQEPISPLARWNMISLKAFLRAKKHGFLGVDPIENWQEATREVDDEWATDFRSFFDLTTSKEIRRQMKGFLGGLGLEDSDVKSWLEMNRQGIEKLSEFNRALIDGSLKLASEQKEVVQQSLDEAVAALKSAARGRIDPDRIIRQAELSMKAVTNAMDLAQDLSAVARGKAKKKKRTPSTTKKKR